MATYVKSLFGYGQNSAQQSPPESNIDLSPLVLDGSKVSFESKNVVGGGSFATVYQGKYRGKQCAIKVFKSGVVRKDIERESQLVSIVQHHPNVVLVHGLWLGNRANRVPDDQPALVMELCSTNLRNYLNEVKKKKEKVLFSVNSKLEILKDVAAGMIHLHSVQIVHGDLAAINILLNIKGSEVVAVKVADFGQARILDADTLHHITATHGKNDNMPPEVKDSQGPVALTKAVDVFSFGCLIPHVASCVYPEPRPDPLGGRSNYQMRAHYIDDKQRHVFETMMMRCLQERPAARGTFEDAMGDIQVLLRKYGKNRQTETLEAQKRAHEKLNSDFTKLQRVHQELQEEHGTLAESFRKAQEDKSKREGWWTALVEERDALAMEKKSLEEQLKQTKQELQQKEGRLQELEKDKERSLKSVDNVGVVFQRYEETKKENETLTAKVKELESDFERLQQQYSATVARSEKYCEDIDHFQKEAARLLKELKESEGKAENMMRSKATVEQQKKDADSNYAALRTQLNGLKRKNENTENELRASRMNAQQLATKNEEMATTARERTKEISGLKGKIADLERQLNQMKTLKDKTERERESAKGAGAVTEKKLKECQSELETEKKHHQLESAKVKAKNRDLDKLREDLQRKDNDLWRMTKEKETYQGQAEAGSTTVKSQQEMLSKAQQKENELNAELRQCQDELEATKSARDNLEQSKKTLEKQNSDLEKEVKKLTFKLEVRVEDLGKKEKDIDGLKTELKEAQKVISEGGTSESVLRERISELEETMKDLTDKQGKTVDKLMKAEKQVAVAEKAQKALEKERDEKTKSIRDLQGKHDELASCIQALETKLAEMTTRNESLVDQHYDEAQKSRLMEKARDSAIERAEMLQTQLNEMHTDLEKLRKTSMLNLHERTDLIEELIESEQQKEADLDSADMDYQELKAELKATVEDRDKTRDQLELLTKSQGRILSKLAMKENERRRLEEHLKATMQGLKAKEEECYTFETAQLNHIQHIEELKREKKLLEGQVAQLNEQLVRIQAGFEIASKERDALLRDTVALKKENESLRHWRKTAKKVKELENQLNKEKMALDTDRKVVADLKEKLAREFVTTRNLQSAVETSVRKSFNERGEAIEEGKRDVEEALGRKERENLDLQHKLILQENMQLTNDLQVAKRREQESANKTRMLAQSYYKSHKYPPFLYQLHQQGMLPSVVVEDASNVVVSEITDLRLYQPDASWCEEFHFFLEELKAMPSKKCQAYMLISFLHCGEVITFYRFHVALVPQVLSCERDLHPNELEGDAMPKAMLVYAQTELKSNNLKEFGITPHRKGVLLQPQCEGYVPELTRSQLLRKLKDTPAGLKHTEECLDANILHQLQRQYREFAKPRTAHRGPPMGVAMALI